jgi:hypothetical protein
MAKNILTDLAFRNLKPTDKDRYVRDGGSLFVRVRSKKNGGTVPFATATGSMASRNG